MAEFAGVAFPLLPEISVNHNRNLGSGHSLFGTGMSAARKAAFGRMLVCVLPMTLLLAWISKEVELTALRRAAAERLYAASEEEARTRPDVVQYGVWAASSSGCSDMERKALFRAGAKMGGGSDWLLRSGWGEAADCCDWKGVSCAGGNGVSSLDLSHQGLKGMLASELATLPSLSRLDVNENPALSGTIPPQLLSSGSKLTHVYAFGAAISGTLPFYEKSASHTLQELEFSSCKLSGTLPSALGLVGSLRHIFLESNRLSGSIPSSLASLRRLRELELSSNRLSGSVPGRVAHMPLEHLDLARNNQALRGVPQQAPKQGCSGGSERYLRGGSASVVDDPSASHPS